MNTIVSIHPRPGRDLLVFERTKPHREIPLTEIVKRSRILVIDDQDFPYQELFVRAGYTLDKWDDVDDLTKLETGEFDLILLDLQGVGRSASIDQGLAVLRHIRSTSPAQLVIAYSGANWPVQYQPFFQLADAVLDKSVDFYEFKRTVDDLLRKRFSLGFYLSLINQTVGEEITKVPKLPTKARFAMEHGRTDGLSRYLHNHLTDATMIDRVLQITLIGLEIHKLWTS